jgi:signal transduction histidine kinase
MARSITWLLRLPLAIKLVGANALMLLVAVIALWSVHQPVPGAWRALVISGIALAGGATVTILLVTLALRPLRDLEAAARRVWGGDLEARVAPSPIADRELSRIGGTLNLLLDGLTADRARMRALAAEVIRTGDRERAMLARELHDSTAQSLAGLVYQLVAAERSSRDPALAEQLSAIRGSASGILEEVRLLSHTVYPRILDDLGLVSALSHLARTMGGHGGAAVSVDVTPSGEAAAKDIPAELASVLYRVAQEAVGNALRHARATRVTIRLDGSPARLKLQVSDDGVGFDLDEAERRRPGMGLFTMRERVSLVHGQLEVVTRPGLGTTIGASVPTLAPTPASHLAHTAEQH